MIQLIMLISINACPCLSQIPQLAVMNVSRFCTTGYSTHEIEVVCKNHPRMLGSAALAAVWCEMARYCLFVISNDYQQVCSVKCHTVVQSLILALWLLVEC